MTNTVGAANIELSVDSTGVETGLARAESAVTRTGRTIQNFGNNGAAAIDSIGAGANGAASRVDSATRSLIGSIQRTTATMEAGSRSSREYYEALANQRGINRDALRPYLDQLDAVASRQRVATAAVDASNPALARVGVSAAQTAAALRGVPAQFTDIVTSLQGGQAPLTVFLQQGGQLRDMFGSAGGAARALGGYISGLINPVTLAAAAVGVLAVAYNQGSKEADGYERALVTTGNAAGTTSGQIADMARSISAVVGTQGKAAETLTAMAAGGQVAGDNLERFSRVAIEMERTVGKSVEDTVADLTALGKAPLEASKKLSEQYRYLTAATYDQIRALLEQGRTEEAAATAQQAYIDAFDERSKKLEGRLGVIERSWRAVKDAAASTWDTILGIGREETTGQKLEGASNVLMMKQSSLSAREARGEGNDKASQQLRDDIKAIQAYKKELEGQADAASRLVAIETGRQALDKADIEWKEQGLKLLSKQKQLEKEIADARKNGFEAGYSNDEIEKRVAAIQKKYASTSSNDGVDAQIEAVKRRAGIEESVAQRSRDLLESNRAAGLVAEEQYIQAVEKLDIGAFEREKARLQEELRLAAGKPNSLKEQAALRGQIAEVEANIITRQLQAGNQLNELEVKRNRTAAENYANAVQQQVDYRDSLTGQVKAQQEANEQIGLSATAMAELTASRLEEIAAIKDRKAEVEDSVDLTGRLSAEYRAQAEALRELAKLKREGATKEVTVQAAKEAAAAWKRTSEQIEEALTDALMRGFESGKSFAENLRDTTINMFKTMVLRPTIQGIVSGGPAGGIAAGGSVLQTASGLGSLYNTFAGLGGTVTGVGNLVGSASISAFGAGLSGGAGVADAVAAYQAAGMTSTASALSAGASVSTGITSAIAAIPGWGWAALGAAAIGAYLMNDGPEKDTRLTFTSNNTAGNISINERGNEGKTGQSYIDGYGTGAFGTFGLSSTFWMDGRQDAVQGFIQTVAKVDDALAGFLTTSEKASVTASVTGKSFTAHTGEEGSDPNAKKQLDEVFAARMNAVFAGIEPGLDNLISGFKGASQELATEAAAILQYRQALAASGEAVFGVKVTLQELAALKTPTEAVSVALARVTSEFAATNAVAVTLGRDAGEAFGAVGLSSLKARENLITLAGGLDKLNQNTSAFAQNYLTVAERNSLASKQVAEQMGALGYASVTTKEQFKALVQGLDVSTEAGAKQYAQLIALSGAFATVADTAAEAAKQSLAAKQALADGLLKGADTALSALQQIVNREKAALQKAHEAELEALQGRITLQTEAVTKFKSLADSLKSTLAQMEVPGQAAGTRQQAQADIRTALAIARAGGPLPDADSLKDALSTVTKDASDQFSSYTDYMRDFYATASDVSGLEDLADSSLSVAEKTLAALNAQKDAADAAYQEQIAGLDTLVENGQQQIDVLKGMDTSLLSIAQGIAGLASAISAANANPIASATGGITAAYQAELGRNPDAAGLEFWQGQVASGATVGSVKDAIANSREAQIRDLYTSLLGRDPDSSGMGFWMGGGASIDDIKAGIVNSDEYIKHLRGFAVGTNYVPQTMPALIHEGERIIPAADNRELMQALNKPAQQNDPALLAEIRALREEVALLRTSSVQTAQNTGKTSDLINNISGGGGPLLVQMEPA